MLTLKTKCLIAYCHTILTDAEAATVQGEGVSITKDKDSQNFMRESGFKIIAYCEQFGATRDELSKLSHSTNPIFLLAREYYRLQITLYQKYISEEKGRHVPILYAGLMFQLLHKNKIVGLNLDYDKLISDIEQSTMLETKEIKSRFRDKTIIERVEINKYHNGVREILEQTMKFKIVKKSKKIVKTNKRRK